MSCGIDLIGVISFGARSFAGLGARDAEEAAARAIDSAKSAKAAGRIARSEYSRLIQPYLSAHSEARSRESSSYVGLTIRTLVVVVSLTITTPG